MRVYQKPHVYQKSSEPTFRRPRSGVRILFVYKHTHNTQTHTHIPKEIFQQFNKRFNCHCKN